MPSSTTPPGDRRGDAGAAAGGAQAEGSAAAAAGLAAEVEAGERLAARQAREHREVEVDHVPAGERRPGRARARAGRTPASSSPLRGERHGVVRAALAARASGAAPPRRRSRASAIESRRRALGVGLDVEREHRELRHAAARGSAGPTSAGRRRRAPSPAHRSPLACDRERAADRRGRSGSAWRSGRRPRRRGCRRRRAGRAAAACRPGAVSSTRAAGTPSRVARSVAAIRRAPSSRARSASAAAT